MAEKQQRVEYSLDIFNIRKIIFTPWTYSIVTLIFMIVVGSFSLINRFNEVDYNRDLQGWKNKLNLIAESRSTDVSRFVSGNFSELRTLADNPSLKLYLAELKISAQVAGAEKPEPAQKSYLRNLLLFTAQHGGFSSANKAIAILGNDNQLIVSTDMSQSLAERLTEHTKSLKINEDEIIDLQKDNDGTLYIGFSIPIYAIRSGHNASEQIGKIIALKTIDNNLFGLLKQVGITEKTLEILLVRKENNQYLAPLMDGSSPLEKYMEETLVENKTSGKSTKNFYEYTDYRGNAVLAIAKDVAGTPWRLIVKIDSAEAFAESNIYRAGAIYIFTLIIAIVTLVIIALWWYSYSRHTLMASAYFRKLATRAQAHEKLLEVVTDNQPEAIYILDEDKNYQFANKTLADNTQMSQPSIIGKKLADIIGAARANSISKECEIALKTQKPSYIVQHQKDAKIGAGEKIIRSAYIPLQEIPVPDLPAKTAGILVVEQDVSEVFFERERRITTMKQLVATLVNLVDRRDPFAANHSSLVSQIAYQMAVDMGLDDNETETTKTAASLMNIGKILVPKILLTKITPLSEDEKNIITESMDAASELLKNIPFDGAVADTIRQWQEKWDGSGRLGLTGDKILVSARIIAVANAFIGMVSPRSWRNAMSIDAANKFLLEQSDSYFDRRAVIALVNYVENRSGREWLGEVLGGKIETRKVAS